MKLKLAYLPGALWIGAFTFSCPALFAQKKQQRDTTSRTVVAGPQYKRSAVHGFLWGKHYRKEWSTPITVKNFYLDTAKGGLIPLKVTDNPQETGLKLQGGNDKAYSITGIDKRYSATLPGIYQNTFVERIVDDQVSIAHPYSPSIVAPLAAAAGMYHTWPKNVYVPQQRALGKYNNIYGNRLYRLEELPATNETGVITTQQLCAMLRQDIRISVDQELFVKTRLFDMLIGDCSRNEDHWRWIAKETEDGTIYTPIPRDRDHAFTKFDGTLLNFVASAAGVGHLQSFAPGIKNIRTYNYAARNLDRVMSNRITRVQWINAAEQLHEEISDKVIEDAVRQMPPEVFNISGKEIIRNLKSRRDHIREYAEEYYDFISKEVDITGTPGDELFEISDDADGTLYVKGYSPDDEGSKGRMFYNRSFPLHQTNELRVYGLGGNDKYDINLTGKSNTAVRIIGLDGKDEYNIASGKKLHVYDSQKDTAARYRYDAYKYNKQGISPSLYYSKQHIIYVGISYKNMRYKWGKYPFASLHEMYLHYSPTQNALRTGYEGVVNNVIGKWNLLLNANFDWVKVVNFFGVGNDTKTQTTDRNFYRLRSESGFMSVGLSRQIGQQGSFVVSPFFQTVKLHNDPDRFLVKDYLRNTFINKDYFDTKKFFGVSAALKLQKVDDQVLPTKGIRFTTSAAYIKNISDPRESYSIAGDLQLYFPLSKHLVLAIKNSAANISGEPEFYQLNPIGGKRLRGYRRERFWGNTAYFNNNELQYLFNVRSFLFNGKAGIMAFGDQGRVWLKGENSNTWHYGYGGGIILSPFNKLYIAASYGISPENKGLIHLELRKTLK